MYEPPEITTAPGSAAIKKESPGINLLIRFNIKYIIKLLVIWMIPITIIALLTGFSSYFLISKYKTDVYKARTIMLRYDKDMARTSKVPYLYPDIGQNTLLETIKLPQNLEEVINRLGLDISEEELFDMIYIEPGNRSNTIHLFVYYTDAEMAAKIANTMCEVYIDAYSRIFNSAADKMYEYYLNQREIATEDVNEAEQALEDYREKKGLYMADEELKLKLKQLSDTELELKEMQMDKAELIAKIEDIKQRVSKLPEKVKVSETMTSQREKELRMLERELEVMLQKYTQSHPEVIELKMKIKQLKNELATGSANADNLPDSETFAPNSLRESLVLQQNQMENSLSSFDEQIENYKQIIADIRTELDSLSSIQSVYSNLQQRVSSARRLLDIIDERIADTRIASNANTHDLTILERAAKPMQPEATGKKLMTLLSTFGMAFISLVFVMIYAIFSPAVKVPSDLDSLSTVEFIGVLPKKRNSTLATYYSTLQEVVNRIDDHIKKGKPTLITISSLKPKEGKTTIIDDITDMKSSAGKKMLIIKRVREQEYNRSIQVPSDSIVDLAAVRNYAEDKPVPIELSSTTSRLYYIVDRNISKLNINPETVNSLLSHYSEYDYIFFELFSLRSNLQVCSCIIRLADYNILLTRYGKNSFATIDKVTRSAVYGTNTKIGTVINCGDLSLT